VLTFRVKGGVVLIPSDSDDESSSPLILNLSHHESSRDESSITKEKNFKDIIQGRALFSTLNTSDTLLGGI